MGAGSLNLGSRMNNAQMNAGGGNADDIMAQNASSTSGGGNGGMGGQEPIIVKPFTINTPNLPLNMGI